MQRFCSEKVQFIVKLKSNSKESNLKEHEICRGELKMESILMSPGLELKTSIPFKIVVDSDRLKKVSVNKNDLQKMSVLSSEAGLLFIETRLYNPDTEAARLKPQVLSDQ